MIKILHCDCKSDYQDSKYGKGYRVHNSRVKQGEYRCTVCSNIKKVE